MTFAGAVPAAPSPSELCGGQGVEQLQDLRGDEEKEEEEVELNHDLEGICHGGLVWLREAIQHQDQAQKQEQVLLWKAINSALEKGTTSRIIAGKLISRAHLSAEYGCLCSKV